MTHEVTVGQAAAIAGIPLEVLRDLCDEGLVPAAIRTPRGHWYLPVNAIPERLWAAEIVDRRYRERLAAAQQAVARVERELESIRLDLVEAAEADNLAAPLGNDVRAASDSRGALNEAFGVLRDETIRVSLLHRRVKALRDSGGAASL